MCFGDFSPIRTLILRNLNLISGQSWTHLQDRKRSVGSSCRQVIMTMPKIRRQYVKLSNLLEVGHM